VKLIFVDYKCFGEEKEKEEKKRIGMMVMISPFYNFD